MRKHIPNFVTLLNLFSGSVAVVLAVQDELELAAIFVFLGIIFDFFDGFAARILRVPSEMGLQLDSLADMVTSGLVPGIVMFQLFNRALGTQTFTWALEGSAEQSAIDSGASLLPFVGFAITMGSAWRLARFNIDEDQVDSFVGLPTPANALFILSLPLILTYQPSVWAENLILNKWFLIAITIASTWMLNAPVRLFALKFKHFQLKGNRLRIFFLLLSLVLLLGLRFTAIPLIIVLYVILSLAGNTREGQVV
ncbi:CDP-alcohol phosphatidyltransferase family protein [Robertkochia aurantiaca]|uniref:CDP-alcohol phosphatidyltransferase family protein n=1 Tax=Robertkochia aurantiaca TaxID=2873700 RepID=UPI001CCD04F2|nr:CDP-alcohol phosphatidyltransferase family protein [Robertkochia sp. 3YJGBD-33]